jgi:hypothetical protein
MMGDNFEQSFQKDVGRALITNSMANYGSMGNYTNNVTINLQLDGTLKKAYYTEGN